MRIGQYADVQDHHEEARRRWEKQLQEANACRSKDSGIEHYKALATKHAEELESLKLKNLDLEQTI